MNTNGVIFAIVVVFLVVFAGLTLIALFSAAPTIGSVISFGFAFLIIGLVLTGVIGAIRNPPDE